MLESHAARLEAPAHCSRLQHPASPTSGPTITTGLTSRASRPMRGLAERQLPPRQPITVCRPAALLWRLVLENALPAASQVVFHHQPSHGGCHPSLPACTADPAFALFSSGWWIGLSAGHLLKLATWLIWAGSPCFGRDPLLPIIWTHSPILLPLEGSARDMPVSTGLNMNIEPHNHNHFVSIIFTVPRAVHSEKACAYAKA